MPEVPEGDPQYAPLTTARREPDWIDKHAARSGVDPNWMRSIMRVESGGKANARTGSYHGLFQLSKEEFKRHGGTGDIYDPEQNTMAAANKIASEKLRFEQRYGRKATLGDVYLIHQQGEAGYNAHMANPDRPAWMNMKDASGRSEAWAKRAITGNMTSAMKAKYGDNPTSAQFVQAWNERIGSESGAPVQPGIGSDVVAQAQAERRAKGQDKGLREGERIVDKDDKEKTPTTEVQIADVPVWHGNVESPDLGGRGRPVEAGRISRAKGSPQP